MQSVKQKPLQQQSNNSTRRTLTLKRGVTTERAAAATPTPKRLPVEPAPLDGGHFFIVWRLNGARPRQRHATLEAAITERDRLAAVCPDAVFLVFDAKRVLV